MSGDSNYTFQFWSREIHFILSFWKHSNRTSSNKTLNFKILESSFLLKKHFHVIFTMFGRFATFPKYHSIARLLKCKPWTNYSLFTYFTEWAPEKKIHNSVKYYPGQHCHVVCYTINKWHKMTERRRKNLKLASSFTVHHIPGDKDHMEQS